jgi:hypothetical protein
MKGGKRLERKAEEGNDKISIGKGQKSRKKEITEARSGRKIGRTKLKDDRS